MFRKRRTSLYNEQIRSEAVDWFIRFCEDDAGGATCSEFDAWLRASPEHVRAYLGISAFWEAAGRMSDASASDVQALVEQAGAQCNVIPLTCEGSPARATSSNWKLKPRMAAIAATVLVSLSLLAGALGWLAVRYPNYSTRTGERRTITLQDGSVVELNAATRIEVRFNASMRLIKLIEGQALFQVAYNPRRPFVVTSDNVVARALGTQFDVNRIDGETIVTVVDGRVAVTPPPDPAPRALPAAQSDGVVLAAGDQVAMAPHIAPARKRADPASTTAWTAGKWIFEDTPLSEVIRDFNRYSERPLSVNDPALSALHVTGTFNINESRQIIRFLSLRFGLVVHDTEQGITLSYD